MAGPVEALLFGTLLGLVISFEPMGHVMASQLNTGAFGLLYVITQRSGVFLSILKSEAGENCRLCLVLFSLHMVLISPIWCSG